MIVPVGVQSSTSTDWFAQAAKRTRDRVLSSDIYRYLRGVVYLEHVDRWICYNHDSVFQTGASRSITTYWFQMKPICDSPEKTPLAQYEFVGELL